jgi:hypothetical protein
MPAFRCREQAHCEPAFPRRRVHVVQSGLTDASALALNDPPVWLARQGRAPALRVGLRERPDGRRRPDHPPELGIAAGRQPVGDIRRPWRA